MVFTASTFLQVILLQRLLDYTPSQAGLVLLPGSLVLSLSFPLAGRLADRCERRVMLLAALSGLTVASYCFTFLHLDWPLSWMVWLVGGGRWKMDNVAGKKCTLSATQCSHSDAVLPLPSFACLLVR